MIEQKKKIGEFLIERGKIEPQDLEIALELQKKSGSKVGEILLAQGKISAYKFYIELAEFLNIPFVDLEKYKINPELLKAEDRQDYYESDYIPFDTDDITGATYIATTNPTTELLLHLTKTYFQYKIFITSPFDILWTLQKTFEKEDDSNARNAISIEMPKISAKNLTFSRQLVSVLFLCLVLGVLSLQSTYFLTSVIVAINIFFFSTLVSKAIFFTRGFFTKAKNYDDEIASINEQELPIYSILVPLYKEKLETINQITNAIKNLNYPLAKLDTKLIVELDDEQTINNIKTLALESNFQIIRVPHSIPKTKPKACNYALRFAKGALVTIYDAEDIPDVNQLKKTYLAFKNTPVSSTKLTAMQCHLNFYNRDENWLTKSFSIEYASWFQFLLYGLQSLKLPIPLGGTSNHFRTEDLNNLRAWDPYNVTEDAELGVRIAANNGAVEVISSTTMEECPNTIRSWLHQRTRWIKGHLQTFIVYMREPKSLIKSSGFFGFLGFFFFIGAPAISYLFVPLSILLYIFAKLQHGISSQFLDFMVFNLYFGIVLHMLIALIVIVKNKWLHILPQCLLFPLYWVLHSIASYMALYQLIKKPHHWNKTEHGVSKFKPKVEN